MGPNVPPCRTQASPLLFDLTSLQREANGRFGFSARTTLSLAQALYEKHKVLTYPRTDSRALPEDYLPVVKETLANLGGVSRHGVIDDLGEVAGLASTRTYPLRSSFAPSYNMAVNLTGWAGRARASTLLESSFAQFQADRGVIGLTRQVRRNRQAMDELEGIPAVEPAFDARAAQPRAASSSATWPPATAMRRTRSCRISLI